MISLRGLSPLPHDAFAQKPQIGQTLKMTSSEGVRYWKHRRTTSPTFHRLSRDYRERLAEQISRECDATDKTRKKERKQRGQEKKRSEAAETRPTLRLAGSWEMQRIRRLEFRYVTTKNTPALTSRLQCTTSLDAETNVRLSSATLPTPQCRQRDGRQIAAAVEKEFPTYLSLFRDSERGKTLTGISGRRQRRTVQTGAKKCN